MLLRYQCSMVLMKVHMQKFLKSGKSVWDSFSGILSTEKIGLLDKHWQYVEYEKNGGCVELLRDELDGAYACQMLN